MEYKTSDIINDEYSDLKKVAKENHRNYVNAEPFPNIYFDNLFEERFLEGVLREFPDLSEVEDEDKSKSKHDNPNEKNWVLIAKSYSVRK